MLANRGPGIGAFGGADGAAGRAAGGGVVSLLGVSTHLNTLFSVASRQGEDSRLIHD